MATHKDPRTITTTITTTTTTKTRIKIKPKKVNLKVQQHPRNRPMCARRIGIGRIVASANCIHRTILLIYELHTNRGTCITAIQRVQLKVEHQPRWNQQRQYLQAHAALASIGDLNLV